MNSLIEEEFRLHSIFPFARAVQESFPFLAVVNWLNIQKILNKSILTLGCFSFSLPLRKPHSSACRLAGVWGFFKSTRHFPIVSGSFKIIFTMSTFEKNTNEANVERLSCSNIDGAGRTDSCTYLTWSLACNIKK